MSSTPPTGQPAPASPVTSATPVTSGAPVRRRRVGRIIFRVLLGVAIGVVVLAALAGTTSVWFVQRTLPQTTGTLSVKGLDSKVSVLRDSWGVPHITGDDVHDVAFAEGYVTAQDRLF